MAQTINSWSVTTDAQVLSQAGNVRFVVDKEALGQIFLWVPQSSLIIIITLMTHTYFINLPMNIILATDGVGEMHTHKL